MSDVSWRVFSAQGRDEHVVIQVAEQVQARDDVLAARTLLANAPWVDGRASAGEQAALALRNQ